MPHIGRSPRALYWRALRRVERRARLWESRPELLYEACRLANRLAML